MIKFTYTKSDNSVSERTLVVITKPSNAFLGVDVSGVDPALAKDFEEQLEILRTAYLATQQDLMSRYDLKHNYRTFLQAGVSNLTDLA